MGVPETCTRNVGLDDSLTASNDFIPRAAEGGDQKMSSAPHHERTTRVHEPTMRAPRARRTIQWVHMDDGSLVSQFLFLFCIPCLRVLSSMR